MKVNWAEAFRGARAFGGRRLILLGENTAKCVIEGIGSRMARLSRSKC